MFKVGDEVVKSNGLSFSNGEQTAFIGEIDNGKYWLKGPGTYCWEDEIALAPSKTTFKVGAKVKVKEDKYIGHPKASSYNLPRTEGVVDRVVGDDCFFVCYGDIISPPVNPNCFELVAEEIKPTPIITKTVTVTEFAEGVYGKFYFFKPLGKDIAIKTVDINSFGNAEMTIDDLREAARIFIEIADYLETKS